MGLRMKSDDLLDHLPADDSRDYDFPFDYYHVGIEAGIRDMALLRKA